MKQTNSKYLLVNNVQRGFTLIEILIAVTIISIFVGGIALSLFGNVYKAQKTRALQDINSIESALEIYRLDNFNYPSQGAGLEALYRGSGANWRGPYIKKLPKDPWSNAYRYRRPGRNSNAFDVYSLGADGAEGGAEEDADIGNWDNG